VLSSKLEPQSTYKDDSLRYHFAVVRTTSILFLTMTRYFTAAIAALLASTVYAADIPSCGAGSNCPADSPCCSGSSGAIVR
jgi:hypothetical protein